MSSILLATIRFTGGYDTARVATDWYYSRATDSVGVLEWQGRIVSEPTYSVQLGCIVWQSRTSVSVGSLDVADTAGELAWDAVEARDAICELRLAERGQSYDETTLVGRCIVDSVERVGIVWRLTLRGIDTLLDRPLQATLFDAVATSSSDTTSTSEGFIDDGKPPNFNAAGNPTLEGDKVPVVYGKVWQHEPPLIDPTLLVHQVTDCGIVEITEVYSGGSIANPPDSSDEDWDYAMARSGFRMFTEPSARVTVNCNGIRALGFPLTLTRFGQDAWTSGGPAGWTVTEGTGAAVTLVDDVGARMTTSNGTCSLAFDTGTSGDEWIVVLVEVAEIAEGYLRVTAGQTYDIKRPGRHPIITTVGDSPLITLEAVREGTADVTVASAAVYPLDPAEGTKSLVEMMRHVIVARAAIPDAAPGEVPIIGEAGDFDDPEDLSKFTTETSVGDGSFAVVAGAAEITAGNFADTSIALLIWESYELQPGERYTFSAGIDTTSWSGARSQFVGVDVVFFPTSGNLADAVTLASVGANEVTTVAGTFEPLVPGLFRIEVSAGDQEQLIARIASLVLTRYDFLDRGETVDLTSLVDVDDGSEFGVVATGSETVRDTVARIMDSVCGWFYPDPSGRIRFGRLRLPSGPPVLTIDASNMSSRPNWQPDLAPGLSDTWAGARNWSPYSDGELAGITYPNRPPFRAEFREKRQSASAERYARPYTHALGAEHIETYLYNGADVASNADRVGALYEAARGVWTVDVALPSASDANLIRCDQIVSLSDPSFGVDDGKLALIVGVAGRYRSNLLTLTLWGATDAS
jgi:hypothetical protein